MDCVIAETRHTRQFHSPSHASELITFDHTNTFVHKKNASTYQVMDVQAGTVGVSHWDAVSTQGIAGG